MSFYLMRSDKFIFIPYNLLAIDFEFITTKVIKNKAKKYIQEIVEVGLIFRTENLVEEYSGIVRPRYFLESKNKYKNSTYSEKFDYKEIENGMDLEKIFEKIKKIYISKETVWISWGKAEYDALKKVCREYDIAIPLPKEDHLDLSVEFKEFYKLNQNVSLDKALSILNISIEERHKALPDAKALMDIVNRMFEDGYKIDDRQLKYLEY